MATINISFQDSLLAAIDEIAKSESRTRSDLLREAVRIYIERKRRWDKIFSYGKRLTSEKKITEEDILSEIKTYRQQKTKSL